MGRKKREYVYLEGNDIEEVEKTTEDEDIFFSVFDALRQIGITTEDITEWLRANRIKSKRKIREQLSEFLFDNDISRYFENTRKLLPRQEVFCEYYAICLNAKHSAILAGYSRKAAKWTGPALLKRWDIKKEIRKRMKL